MSQQPNLLEVKHLQVEFPSVEGTVAAVRGISFLLKKGEVLGIAGESGSGKSVASLAMMGLLPQTARIAGGEMLFQTKQNGTVDLAKLPAPAFRKLRGSEMAMIFQDPMTSLNPVMRCGEQLSEALRLHLRLKAPEARKQVLDLFGKVKLPDPERIYSAYPHQLSGGQRQRAMIAMALSCNPSLLIADEPTSALDATVQRAILDLMNELKKDWDGSLIFISHDLRVVAEMADRVLIMQNGGSVEEGKVADVFDHPQHPYTQNLLARYRQRSKKQPAIAPAVSVSEPAPVLRVRDLQTWFPAKRNFFGKPKAYIKAVDGVSFEMHRGETLGLVGESGSGKTTLGRSILHLLKPSGGEVFFNGENLALLAGPAWKSIRKNLQVIFQDPYTSLNPRQPIGMAIAEPMRVHGILTTEKDRRARAMHLLVTVGLDAAHFWRFPAALSGGQRQRACIARALALEPSFLICDECVSSLDATVQAQVLDLLKDLQDNKGLTYLFISHDLAIVRQMSDRIAVMKDGKIIEMGPTEEVWNHPREEYTRQLLRS